MAEILNFVPPARRWLPPYIHGETFEYCYSRKEGRHLMRSRKGGDWFQVTHSEALHFYDSLFDNVLIP